MTGEMIDFNNILVLRNRLAAVPIEELLKLYQDKDKYMSFLDSVVLLSDKDSAFLFFSDGEFFRSMAYDAWVFAALRDGNLESIQDDNLFLLSFNFLLKNCPELFQDKNARDNATALLDKVGKKTRIFGPKKRKLKEAKKNFQMVVEKKRIFSF